MAFGPGDVNGRWVWAKWLFLLWVDIFLLLDGRDDSFSHISGVTLAPNAEFCVFCEILRRNSGSIFGTKLAGPLISPWNPGPSVVKLLSAAWAEASVFMMLFWRRLSLFFSVWPWDRLTEVLCCSLEESLSSPYRSELSAVPRRDSAMPFVVCPLLCIWLTGWLSRGLGNRDLQQLASCSAALHLCFHCFAFFHDQTRK